MGRLLTHKGGLPSPPLAGPGEADLIPSRLQKQADVPNWKQATRRFTALVKWLDENEPAAHRALSYPVFTKRWARAAWSELYRIDELACQWASTTVFLTFSGSYWLDKDSLTFCPPVTYFKALQNSRQARRKALSRLLTNVPRWQSIRAIGGGGNNGYPRVFLGLYLSEPINTQAFEPVVNAHLNNSPVAGTDAHDIETIVSTQQNPQHKSQLIHTLGKQVPGLKSANGITAESWEKQKIATLLHAGNWRPYTFGQSI